MSIVNLYSAESRSISTASGGSKKIEKGGGGRQFISSILIHRKCAQRNAFYTEKRLFLNMSQ